MINQGNVSSMDDYRNRLRQSLDATRGVSPMGYARPGIGQAGSGPIAQPEPPPPDAEGGFGAGEGPDMSAAQSTNTSVKPMADFSNQQATPSPPAGGMDAASQAPKDDKVGPPKDLKYDKSKLKEAKTVGEHIDAMQPTSRNKFMNWWEQEHGSINDAYDTMQAKLGKRPDASDPLTRREKFSMLMDFGVNLIKASQGGAKQPGAVAVGATVEGMGQKTKEAQAAYDARSGQIEQQRGASLKNLGTYGQALEGQATIDMRAAQQDQANRQGKLADIKSQAEEDKSPTTLGTDQGLHSWNAKNRKFEPVLGADGKPLTNMVVGSRGGIRQDASPMQVKLHQYLKSIGKSDEEAEAIAFHEKSGDPRKDYLTVFGKALSSTFGDEASAKKIAQNYIEAAYPAGTDIATDSPKPRSSTPSRPAAASAPPISALTKGKVTKFKNGQRWRLGANGQPEQVK